MNTTIIIGIIIGMLLLYFVPKKLQSTLINGLICLELAIIFMGTYLSFITVSQINTVYNLLSTVTFVMIIYRLGKKIYEKISTTKRGMDITQALKRGVRK